MSSGVPHNQMIALSGVAPPARAKVNRQVETNLEDFEFQETMDGEQMPRTPTHVDDDTRRRDTPGDGEQSPAKSPEGGDSELGVEEVIIADVAARKSVNEVRYMNETIHRLPGDLVMKGMHT